MNPRVIEVKATDLLMTLEHMKKEGYDYFSFMTAVDYLDRFVLYYRLVNVRDGSCVTIKTEVEREDPEIDSATKFYRGANWHEREVYDLFGIVFRGHPELKRILLYEGFNGHPLRKDWEDSEVEKRPGDFV